MLIEIAGVPMEVICRYPANEGFMRDYVTRKHPVFTVAATDDDMERMQTCFDQMDVANGIPVYRRTAADLENNAIHAQLAEKLVEHNVLLMHGSALCMDGQAVIFTAPSGTGKSTHARLWRTVFGDRVWMINDDKPMIRIDEMRVYGTPWDGKHRLSRNDSAPVKAIVRLERSESNWIRPMGNSDAFSVLMEHAFGSRNPVTMARIMGLEQRLLNVAHFFVLGCNMEPEAAMVAWKGIQNWTAMKMRRAEG